MYVVNLTKCDRVSSKRTCTIFSKLKEFERQGLDTGEVRRGHVDTSVPIDYVWTSSPTGDMTLVNPAKQRLSPPSTVDGLRPFDIVIPL